MTSQAEDCASLTAVGAGGKSAIVGVRVELAFIPVESVTTYVIAAFTPAVAFASAARVTTPVD